MQSQILTQIGQTEVFGWLFFFLCFLSEGPRLPYA